MHHKEDKEVSNRDLTKDDALITLPYPITIKEHVLFAGDGPKARQSFSTSHNVAQTTLCLVFLTSFQSQVPVSDRMGLFHTGPHTC